MSVLVVILIFLIISNRNQISLPLVLNPDHGFYHQLGLGRSCLLLRTHVISDYAKKHLLGVDIPPVTVGDDIFTKGGDFIISDAGQLVYAYITIENERPSVKDLLDFLKT